MLVKLKLQLKHYEQEKTLLFLALQSSKGNYNI